MPVPWTLTPCRLAAVRDLLLRHPARLSLIHNRPALGGIARRRATPLVCARAKGSASSSRWKQRQTADMYARDARGQGLKSRAAFKLIEMHERYKLFKPRQTVIDLGYAPGSWTQVAVEHTGPGGRVVGVDIQMGVGRVDGMAAAICGDITRPYTRTTLKQFLREMVAAQHRAALVRKVAAGEELKDWERELLASLEEEMKAAGGKGRDAGAGKAGKGGAKKKASNELETDGPGKAKPGAETGKRAGDKEASEELKLDDTGDDATVPGEAGKTDGKKTPVPDLTDEEWAAVYEAMREDEFLSEYATWDPVGAEEAAKEEIEERRRQAVTQAIIKEAKANREDTHTVDIVLSDMLMNTSGNTWREHFQSMYLCRAAIRVAGETLKRGGHFVCKFYPGDHDKKVERVLRAMFQKVDRFKPKSSRQESRETYWVARNKRANAEYTDLLWSDKPGAQIYGRLRDFLVGFQPTRRLSRGEKMAAGLELTWQDNIVRKQEKAAKRAQSKQ